MACAARSAAIIGPTNHCCEQAVKMAADRITVQVDRVRKTSGWVGSNSGSGGAGVGVGAGAGGVGAGATRGADCAGGEEEEDGMCLVACSVGGVDVSVLMVSKERMCGRNSILTHTDDNQFCAFNLFEVTTCC